MKKAILLAIVASLGLSLSAVAGEKGEKKGNRFAKADTDQSKSLNLAEFTPLHQKKLERMKQKSPERAAEMSARLTDLLAGYAQFAQEAKALTHTDEELQRLSDLGYADGPEDR